MKLLQRGDGDFASRFFRAKRIQTVAGFAKQRAAHGETGALEQFIFARADAGNLDFLFALQFVCGENRIQNHIGEQIQTSREIFAQYFCVDAETIIAAVAVNVAADGFNLDRNLFGAARFGAFDEHLGEQHRCAVVVGVFREDTAFKHGAKFHERQTMIFLHQQRQAIRQNNFLNRVIFVRLNVCLRFGRRAFGQQRV